MAELAVLMLRLLQTPNRGRDADARQIDAAAGGAMLASRHPADVDFESFTKQLRRRPANWKQQGRERNSGEEALLPWPRPQRPVRSLLLLASIRSSRA